MRKAYTQLTFDDLLGIPAVGEIVERHGRRLNFREAAARIGGIVILNISTESHEWMKAVRVLRTAVTKDGERRLICDRNGGFVYLGERSFLRKNTYRGKCLPEFGTEVYDI